MADNKLQWPSIEVEPHRLILRCYLVIRLSKLGLDRLISKGNARKVRIANEVGKSDFPVDFPTDFTKFNFKLKLRNEDLSRLNLDRD